MKTLKLSNRTYAQVQRLLKEGGNSALDIAVREALDLSSTQNPYSMLKSYGFDIDFESANAGVIKPQELAVKYLNGLGKAMLTLPIVYRAISMPSQEKALKSIREDCRDSMVVLDDGVFYNPDFSGKIVHNYGSSVVSPIEIYVPEIPVYEGENAKTIIEGHGLQYARAFLGTKDKPNKMLKNLEELAQLPVEKILFWTLMNQELRKMYPEQVAGLDYDSGKFLVLGYGLLNYGGRSRGVQIIPRSGRAKR